MKAKIFANDDDDKLFQALKATEDADGCIELPNDSFQLLKLLAPLGRFSVSSDPFHSWIQDWNGASIPCITFENSYD